MLIMQILFADRVRPRDGENVRRRSSAAADVPAATYVPALTARSDVPDPEPDDHHAPCPVSRAGDLHVS